MAETNARPRTGPLAHTPTPEELKEMNRIAKVFILSSLAYFMVGALMGFAFAAGHPKGYHQYIFVHVHLLLIGWICFLIFGVGYKLIPTAFALKPKIWSFKMAWFQFFTSHVGVLGLTIFWVLRVQSPSNAFIHIMVVASSAVLFVSIGLFALNILFTFTKEVT